MAATGGLTFFLLTIGAKIAGLAANPGGGMIEIIKRFFGEQWLVVFYCSKKGSTFLGDED